MEKCISAVIKLNTDFDFMWLVVTAKTCETTGMGHGVASGPEFRNCTRTCRTHDCDTAELPVPLLHPNHVLTTGLRYHNISLISGGQT